MAKRLIVLLTCLVFFPVAGPAVAQPPTDESPSRTEAMAAAAKGATRHPVKQGYTRNWVWHPRGPKLKNKCVFIEVRATMKGRWYHTYGDSSTFPDSEYITWERLRLVNPSVTAVGWPESSTGGCYSLENWRIGDGSSLRQAYHSASCALSVSLGVGVSLPWSIGISATPSYSCGDDKIGGASVRFGKPHKQIGQSMSGVVLRYDVANGTKETGVGFGARYDVKVCFRGRCDVWREPLTMGLFP